MLFMAFIAFRKLIDYGILRPTENILDESLARCEISDLESLRLNCRARLRHSSLFVYATKGDQKVIFQPYGFRIIIPDVSGI